MEITEIISHFGIEDIISAESLNSGHINRTFLAESSKGDKYVLQTLNSRVFGNPEAVMSNIRRISEAFEKSSDKYVKVPEYLLADDGRNYIRIDGEVYRLYRYTEPEQISDGAGYRMGFSYGRFIRTINSGRVRLETTINNFHSFSSYFNMLASADSMSQLKKIDKAVMMRLSSLLETLSQVFTVDFQQRNVHNDAKRDNIIFGSPCTVIDLDTAMKGYAAVDYGDMIRSSCKAEQINFPLIKDITLGFADGLDGILTDDEIFSLYYGILYVTGELAARYLIDYLRDEKYFNGKTSAECLSRANSLLRQLSVFISCGEEITSIIYKAFKKQ